MKWLCRDVEDCSDLLFSFLKILQAVHIYLQCRVVVAQSPKKDCADSR